MFPVIRSMFKALGVEEGLEWTKEKIKDLEIRNNLTIGKILIGPQQGLSWTSVPFKTSSPKLIFFASPTKVGKLSPTLSSIQTQSTSTIRALVTIGRIMANDML